MQKKIIIWGLLGILLTALLISLIFADTKYEWFTEGNDSVNNFYEGDMPNAQTFTIGTTGANESFTIGYIKLMLQRVGTPEIMTAEIHTVNSSGAPNMTLGNALSTGTINASTFGAGGAWHKIDMSDYTVSAGEQLAIVLYCGGDISNKISWWKNSTGGYAEGTAWYSATNGTIDKWTLMDVAVTPDDFMFEVWQEETILTSLDYPANASSSANEWNLFNSTSTPTGGFSLTNATINIWYSNGTIFNETTNILTGTSANSTYWNISGFDTADYTWNVLSCGNNVTGSLCNYYDNNYTFTIGLSEDSETWIGGLYETSNERFEVNVSLLAGTLLRVARLLYNGSYYSGTFNEVDGNNYNIYTSIDIPLVNSTYENKSFHWELTYESALGTDTYYNTSWHNQTVTLIEVGSCAGDLTVEAMNFTCENEELLTPIRGWDFKATIFYWLGNGAVMKNISFDESALYDEKTVCINPANVTYYLIDSDIQYTANTTQYVERNYYFDNHTINNETQNITLYLLNASDSTSFILSVVNQNQQKVEDALVYTQRYYPELGYYKTVQIAKTDANGKSIGFFKTETVDYRFLIEKNGLTELITSKQKVVPEETSYTLLFIIGVTLESPWADFEDLDDLDYDLYFNSTSNITTFTWVDISGNFTQARLLVEEIMYNQTNNVICNTTSALNADTITCDLNDYSGTFIAQGYITRTGEKAVSLVYAVITSVVEIMGFAGVFLAFFIILVAGCAFFWHPIAGILGINFAVIMVNVIGLISFSSLFIFGLLGISIILIFILKD